MRIVRFKKAIWLCEVRKQTLMLPEPRTEKEEKFRRVKQRLIFESNISLKEENWEGDGNTESVFSLQSKQNVNTI